MSEACAEQVSRNWCKYHYCYKKLADPEPLSSLLRIDSTTEETRIMSAAWAKIGQEWHQTTALLDSGARASFASKDFLLSRGWKTGDSPASYERPSVADGRELANYGAYACEFCMVDTNQRRRVETLVFHVIDLKGVDFLMGMDWLKTANPGVDFATQAWRWPIAQEQIEVIEPQQFFDEHKDSSAIFAVTLSAVGDDPTQSKREVILPKQYREFEDVFSAESADLLPTGEHQDHAIETLEGKEPPYGPLYSLSKTELETLRAYLDANLARGWIRHSKSPAGAPIIFVPKKDGTLRLCVDYRGLNAVTIRNRHPLPLIEETLDRMVGAKVFTKLDLREAYHRVRIRKGDEWKTAFRTRYGHFEYLVMPFGLANAPATFQCYINRAMEGLVDRNCVVYLDDILVYSDNEIDHEKHVRAVLERLRRHGLYVKLDKCAFHVEQVEFLGFLVSSAGITMDPRRVDTIMSWPVPKSFREIQVFLGFANFYRRFIYRYSRVVAPITDLLKGMQQGKKTGPFIWPEGAAQAFRKLREAFTTAPILRHFDPELPIRVESDASGSAIAANMFQPASLENADRATSKHWHPVAFWSRKMSPQESRYEVHDQELLAIVMAFKEWRHYLEGSRFPVAVITDHNNLRYFMTTKELSKRQARWALKLAAYDFTIHYRAGKLNSADAPSRRPDYTVPAAVDENLPTLQNKLRNVSELGTQLLLNTRAGGQRPAKQGGDSKRKRNAPVAPTGRQGRGTALRLSAQVEKVAENLKDLIQVMGQYHNKVIQLPNRADNATPVQRSSGSAASNSELGELRELSPEDETSEDACVKAAPQNRRNIVQDALNPVAGTVGCNQLVPRLLAINVGDDETVYGRPLGDLKDLIALVQERDAFTRTKLRDLESHAERNPSTGDMWKIQDDLLYRRNAIYVPGDSALIGEIIRRHHDDALAGHWGVDKTVELIARKYFLDGAKAAVKAYVDTCEICQRTKARRHRQYGELSSLPQPGGPWQEISMDFITDLPECSRKACAYDSILVVVDRYTKMAKYYPTQKTCNAEELANLIVDNVVAQYGMPNGIVSDRGSVFTSHFWSGLCYHAKIKRRLSTAFHPQTDGQTERQNQTLELYLRIFCNWKQNNWLSLLPMAEFSYNNAAHSTTGMSPFFALYGFHPRMSFDIEANALEGEIPAARERAERLSKARNAMDERWKRAVEWQTNAYNKKHKPMTFKVGDEVLLATKHLRLQRPNRKLMDRFLGPFKVKEIRGSQAYELKLPDNYQIHPTFHVSLLEPYVRRSGALIEYPETGPVTVEGEDEYEVEEILDDRIARGKRQYRVRWKDWNSAHDTWEPEENLLHAGRVFKDWKRQNATTAQSSRKRGRPAKLKV